jgi:hypothetical protein
MAGAAHGVVLLALLACGGGPCGSEPLREVPEVEELAYPSCGEGELPEGEVIAEGTLVAGPGVRDARRREEWSYRRRDCLVVLTQHLAWRLGTADVEVVYDDDFRPLRVWMRTYSMGAPPDIRLYELRAKPAWMKRKTPRGETEYRLLEGDAPIAALGPGRAAVSAWAWAAELEVGAKERGPILDFRARHEEIDEVTLARLEPRSVDYRPEPVRVYSVWGREAVYLDEKGRVVGDLEGMRPPDAVEEVPPPLPERPPMETRSAP